MALDLAEVIAELRTELADAIDKGRNEALRFEVGPVELELTVAVEKSGTTGGKVKFWVVEAGVDGKIASTSTQKVKVTLTPRQSGVPGPPEVSGSELPGER